MTQNAMERSVQTGVRVAEEAACCHLCGSRDVEQAETFANLLRVTSDCKPWKSGGHLARCRTCGLVQTLTTPDWQREAGEIYAGYTIYHQGGGAEQSVFTGRDGTGTPRSEVLVRTLAEHHALAASGRLLDVGCGNGSFLRACSRVLPGWHLAGSEVDDKSRPEVEAIPGVDQLHVTTDLTAIPGSFDVVSLIHVLEHIPSPLGMLRAAAEKLAPGGMLLIEVPDCRQNPFMMLVADHCSHFSVEGVAALVEAAGFEVLTATGEWIPKEVTVVARKRAVAGTSMPRMPEAESHAVFEGFGWLMEVLDTALAHPGSLGIFGTSIAATWLDAELNGAATFFVDEDPSRVGKEHMGRPILAPADVPRGAAVFLALPPVVAERVGERLATLRVEVLMPPPLCDDEVS